MLLTASHSLTFMHINRLVVSVWKKSRDVVTSQSQSCLGCLRTTRSLESRMSDCFSAVADWMISNRLQLNATKTEILWCTSSRRQHQLPTSHFTVGNDQVTPVTSVSNLGIYVDADLSMPTHVSELLLAALLFCVA